METQEISKKNREFYNRPWFWIIVGVVVLVAIGSSNNSGSGNAGSNAQESAPVTAASAPEQKAAAPAPVPAVKAAPVKSSTPSQPTYKTPSDATANNNGTVVTPPPAPPASWHTVATFSGSADTNTNDFAIKGSKWRIDWSFSFPPNNASYCQQYGCNMAVQIFTDDGNNVDQFLQEGQQPSSGTVYEYGKATGNMYLHVIGGNVSWTLNVEDYY